MQPAPCRPDPLIQFVEGDGHHVEGQARRLLMQVCQHPRGLVHLIGEHRHHIGVVPGQVRAGTYFPEGLLERRKHAERALTSVIATCYLHGVSTRLARVAPRPSRPRTVRGQARDLGPARRPGLRDRHDPGRRKLAEGSHPSGVRQRKPRFLLT